RNSLYIETGLRLSDAFSFEFRLNRVVLHVKNVVSEVPTVGCVKGQLQGCVTRQENDEWINASSNTYGAIEFVAKLSTFRRAEDQGDRCRVLPRTVGEDHTQIKHGIFLTDIPHFERQAIRLA